MSTFNVGDVGQVILTWDTPLASVAQNVWHIKMLTGAGADSDDILAALLTQQRTAFALLEDDINDGFEAVLLELRQWDFTLNRFDGVGSLAVTLVAGQSVVDYEPHGVALLGRLITDTARRQGRTFIPGLDQNNVNAGVIDALAEAAFLLYLASWDTDISVTGGLLSWCTFNTDPTSPLFETAALAAQTVVSNSLPSYLTKRKPNVGL